MFFIKLFSLLALIGVNILIYGGLVIAYEYRDKKKNLLAQATNTDSDFVDII